MKRIVVGVDFSERAAKAEAQALTLARRAGAELILAHVIDPELPARFVTAAEEEAHERASALAAVCRNAGVPSRFVVRRGEAHVEIPAIARETGADLVVIGAYRISPERNAFVGTTADRILRANDLPVLVVRSPEPHDYRSAIAAIDPSAPDSSPLAGLASLGLVDRDRITAALCFETDAMRALKSQATSLADLKQAFANEEPAIKEIARGLVDEAGIAGLKIIVRPILLNTPDLIFNIAREANADLIVAGSRRKGPDHKRVLGSVSEQIMRRANVDVLIVRAA